MFAAFFILLLLLFMSSSRPCFVELLEQLVVLWAIVFKIKQEPVLQCNRFNHRLRSWHPYHIIHQVSLMLYFSTNSLLMHLQKQ